MTGTDIAHFFAGVIFVAGGWAVLAVAFGWLASKAGRRLNGHTTPPTRKEQS